MIYYGLGGVFHMNTIGGRIRALREGAKLTQQDLANALKAKGAKVSRVSVVRWESNTVLPNAYPIKCLAEIFGTSMDFLMDGILVNPDILSPIEKKIIRKYRDVSEFAHCLKCVIDVSDDKIKIVAKLVCSMLDEKIDTIKAG